jgi:hypothetical protein
VCGGGTTGRTSAAWLVRVCGGGTRTWLVRVHYNLRRKRSNPEFEEGHLPAMTIDPIDEAADDLIVEDDSDSDY